MDSHPTQPAPDIDTSAPDLAPSPRSNGWTTPAQQRFLAEIADGATVEIACAAVGLSVQSAYAFRRRAAGSAFALGWQAAVLLARETLADRLLTRALDGQQETTTRADGATVTRRRFDNRLATAMLARLDRLADTQLAEGSHAAARLAARDFDAFLAMLGQGGGPARAALFLAARSGAEVECDLAPILALGRADRFLRAGAGRPSEIAIADLDPARRDLWTADQWRRAEAAGLLALAPEAAPQPDDETAPEPKQPKLVGEDEETDAAGEPTDGAADWPPYRNEDRPVWRDDSDEWRTRFPPPPGFDDYEDGDPFVGDYERSLTPEEEAVMDARYTICLAALAVDDIASRDSFFGFVPVEPAPEPEPEPEIAPVPEPRRGPSIRLM